MGFRISRFGRRCVLLSGFVLLASLAFAAGQDGKSQLPDGPGKAALQKICSGCHAPEIVIGRHETKDGWERIVGEMVEKGANGTDDEFNAIIDYLAANFPAKAAGTGDTK